MPLPLLAEVTPRGQNLRPRPLPGRPGPTAPSRGRSSPRPWRCWRRRPRWPAARPGHRTASRPWRSEEGGAHSAEGLSPPRHAFTWLAWKVRTDLPAQSWEGALRFTRPPQPLLQEALWLPTQRPRPEKRPQAKPSPQPATLPSPPAPLPSTWTWLTWSLLTKPQMPAATSQAKRITRQVKNWGGERRAERRSEQAREGPGLPEAGRGSPATDDEHPRGPRAPVGHSAVSTHPSPDGG